LKPVLAGSAVVIIALVILLLKPFKFEVAPEQQAAANDNSLAVLYFDNVADPTDSDKMGQMITSLLITGLSESQYLQVTSRQRLYDILSQLGKGEAKSVDRTTASQVATKAGVRWMVTGEILQSSPRIILTAEVSEVGTGKLVTTQKISGEAGEDVFAVADRLGSAIRGNLALPTQAKAEQTKSLSEVTTRSPEAYRYYTEGVDYNLRYYAKEALASFQKALSYDSTFAMVYYQLTNIAGISGDIDNSQRLEWIAKAEQYASHASEKEQLYIKSAGHFMRSELGFAIADLNKLLERWPNEVEALWTKVFVCRAAGRDYEGIAAAEKAAQINPEFADAFNQLAYMYLRVGNRERSKWAIDRYAELTPGDANQYDSRADLHAYVGEAEEAKEQYRRALQVNPGFGDDHKLAFMYLVTGDDARADSIFQSLANSGDRSRRAKGRAHLHVVDAYHGRFDKAARILDDAIAADRTDGYDGNWYLGKLAFRMDLHIVNREWDQAISLATKIAERNEQDFPEVPDMSRLGLAVIMHWGDDSRRAQGVLDDLRSEILALKDTTGWTSALDKIAAYDALLFKNDPKAACAAFGQTYLFNRSVPDVYQFGKAYLETGDAENAINLLERDISYLREETFYSSYFNVRSHYVLGMAYEQSGQKDKAAAKYKQFLEIWKGADPDIPEIDDARERLAKLVS
jgi:tetratricopeptide (TPR) repeat protein